MLKDAEIHANQSTADIDTALKKLGVVHGFAFHPTLYFVRTFCYSTIFVEFNDLNS